MTRLSISFLIGIGETGSASPAYLVHCLKTDAGKITSLEQIFQDENISNQPNCTKMPLSITKPILVRRQYTINDITSDSPTDFGGVENAKRFFNYRFFEYDQESREWENYRISKSTLDSLLTKGIDTRSEKSVYLSQLNEDPEQTNYYAYSPCHHPVLYDVMRDLETYSDDIIFTVDGNLDFDCGQVISIYERGDHDSKKEQFNGRWLVTKIEHSFRNKQYFCYFHCSRRFRSVKELSEE